jgi:DnaJ-related protein SCJ1
LDDHVVTIEKNRVTQPGEVEVIKGEGMPFHNDPSTFGDLFVEYRVEIPENFSEEQKELWQLFFKDK